MSELDRLEKLIHAAIDSATYQKAARGEVADLLISPSDAQFLAGILQKYRDTDHLT